ncbi:MAG: zinc-dependent alcohol dehydrogenase family protein [Gammaproteobacteria bacterium]|jgi:propanol-preferring alcohol dehydrogenase|nr:zinc-dependent alcohol dehydrogenase family protein [Gammaproteobacteria bacterium]MDH3863723.1 zinc-dependent alcohol dehydrogenase family protein [Gammaproteobacteria bacterium]MDH3904349.1 zinc-dependent alcohol dehydrogenase family protein [Gammaproteobacteria bacterium]MDH4004819.1 zinc-dependent alcohol dehydrogenase family protein [Gammaproteobacteria bacterium]NCF58429.1 alcohol dehydrogenase catalytic domain-containing protein [Gammaproteobacteria bacterium]
MRAMLLHTTGSLESNPEPLVLADVDDPSPADDEILIRVAACGVCHTELDEIEGRTPPPKFPVIPGHEVVGRVVATGRNARRFRLEERVGVGWIHSSDGTESENISPAFRATGRDVDGGYAELMTVPEAYAARVPDAFNDIEAAPLMCAGAVGYRSLRLTGLVNGETLGLTGFGGSGHLVLQMARHLYPDSPVFVFARSERERRFALELGAHWSGDTGEPPPGAPKAIIDTTPAWKPVILALERLQPGGRLVINAIRKENTDRELLAEIRYEDHLWLEKEIKTVANVTHWDLSEFLPVAADVPLHVETQTYPLEAANEALTDLRRGDIRGAKVLTISS